MNYLRILYVSNLVISNIALYFFDKHIDILRKIIVLKVKTYDINSFFQHLLIIPGILYPFSPMYNRLGVLFNDQ